MEDKEKQITEMAKTMCFQANSCTVKSCVQVNCEKTWLAENLYNAGYRKLPEDSVVLSREEFEDEITELKEENKELKEEIDTFNHLCNEWVKITNKHIKEIQHLKAENKELKNQLKQTSRETAEKFKEVVLNTPRTFTSTQDTFTKEDVETFLNIGLNTVICEVCKLAKQFGVEHGR